MRTLIVIVNYRTPDLTIECLRSLAPEVAKSPRTQVVVVDNASPDDSVPRLGEAIRTLSFDPWCHLLPMPQNGGFAYGNNAGISWANANGTSAARSEFDLVWLLNPDTIVLEGALQSLERHMRENPSVGIGGSRIVNLDGSTRLSAFRFPSALGELESIMSLRLASRVLRRFVIAPPAPSQATRVDWVSGASMMVRAPVFAQIGLLDEDYFMYFEETDFCLRAARSGIECWYLPEGRIVHLVGKSSGVTGTARSKKRRPGYWFASRGRYFRRNLGSAAFHAANLLWLLAYPLGSLLLAVRGRKRDDPPLLWWDFLRFNYFHPARDSN
jgi:N-acetylglucosaminyl-diphospho-decaprenol L-rhamnosyltransferase